MQFDYETAWEKLAKPGFDIIMVDQPDVFSILTTITETCRNLPQDHKTLDLPWPDGLKARFEAIDSTVLAISAFMVYNYGHWMPGGENPHRSLETWRFANFADQILRERLNIVKDNGRTGVGFSFDVDRGLLILKCRTLRGDSMGSPVCFAVPEARDVAQGVVNLARLSTPPPDFGAICDRCVQEAAPREGLGAACFRLGDFTVSDERYRHKQACREAAAKGEPLPEMPRPKSDEGLAEWYAAQCAASAWAFTIDRVIRINHRLRDGVSPFKHDCPAMHPFVVGPTHIAKSNGILDPNVAPCHGCGRDYKDHTSDRVAVIRLLRSLPRSEGQPMLQAFLDYAKQDGIDGVIFMDTPEKHRIIDDEKPKLALAE